MARFVCRGSGTRTAACETRGRNGRVSALPRGTRPRVVGAKGKTSWPVTSVLSLLGRIRGVEPCQVGARNIAKLLGLAGSPGDLGAPPGPSRDQGRPRSGRDRRKSSEMLSD